jgi:hypothetical protein
MRKLFKVSVLFVILILMVVAVGSVAAEEGYQTESSGTAARINFELAGHVAQEGVYVIQEPGGRVVTTWYALDGWQDSGWLNDLSISFENVWVQVVYYPGPDTEGTEMVILNHAPDETYGWLSKGEAHALEVAWPDTEIAPGPGAADAAGE